MARLSFEEHVRTDQDGEFIPWYCTYNLDYLFELDITQLQSVLPQHIHAVEVRPGVGLLSMGYLLFDPGNVGIMPGFSELSCCVVVHSDLSVSPQARFGLYVINITSDSELFLDWAYEIDKIPVYRPQGIRFETDREKGIGIVKDSTGIICELRSCFAGPPPSFHDDLVIVHMFTKVNGVLYRTLVKWFGLKFEHQKIGDGGRLYNHPFFGGLDVESSDGTCYLQLLTPAHGVILQQFYTNHMIL